MKITVSTAALKSALRLTARGVKTNSPIPILANIKLYADAEFGLNLTATDYEFEVSADIGCKIEEEGAVTLPAKQFLGIISHLSGDEIKIKSDSAFTATLQSGHSRYTLEGMDPNEFPALPVTRDDTGVVIPQYLLREMMERTVHAVGKDENRPALCGGSLRLKGDTAEMCATDLHRLAIYRINFDGDTGRDETAIIPKRAMVELPHFLSGDEDAEVEVLLDESQIQFNMPPYEIKCRLIAGTPPNPDKPLGIVKEYQHSVTLDRLPWIEVLKRMDVIAREDEVAHRVRCEFSETTLAMRAEARSIGISEETLETERAKGALTIWLRADQLQEMLQSLLGDQVTVCFGTAQQPILAYSEGPNYEILMPLVPPQEGNE